MRRETIESRLRDIISKTEKGDVIAASSSTTPVDFEMDRLKSVEDIDRWSVGLRVFSNGRVGNSYINSFDDIDALYANALASAELGEELDIDLPGPAEYRELPLCKPEVDAVTKEEMIERGDAVMKRLKAIDPEAQASVTVGRSHEARYLYNTSGFRGYYEETGFSLHGSLLRVEEGGGLLSVGDGDGRNGLNLDIETMISNIEWRYRNSLKKVDGPTGYFPVLFMPEALGLLLDTVETAVNGKTLWRGISVLDGREGQTVLSPRISLFDDPFHIDGSDCFPFDDEGTVPSAMPVIEDGVFRNFCFDLATAKRTGRVSNGRGRRGTSSLPSPGNSNLVMKTGASSLDAMIASIDRGLIVCEFLGGGMSNVVAGDFSVNVELGWLVEKGKVIGRVKDTMVSGNAWELLKGNMTLENRLHRAGSLLAPHILLESVSVTGGVEE